MKRRKCQEREEKAHVCALAVVLVKGMTILRAKKRIGRTR